jgi:hypothetical protein
VGTFPWKERSFRRKAGTVSSAERSFRRKAGTFPWKERSLMVKERSFLVRDRSPVFRALSPVARVRSIIVEKRVLATYHSSVRAKTPMFALKEPVFHRWGEWTARTPETVPGVLAVSLPNGVNRLPLANQTRTIKSSASIA